MSDETPAPRKRLPCLVCGKPLAGVWDDPDKPLTPEQAAYIQPNDALMFFSTGHYGSTVWDPPDSAKLEVHICDTHIREAQSLGRTNEIPIDRERISADLRQQVVETMWQLSNILASLVDHDALKVIAIDIRMKSLIADLKRIDPNLEIAEL